MDIKQFHQDESGYTLIELLIALQLSAIIIGIIYMNYQFIQNYLVRMEERINFEIRCAAISDIITKQLTETREVVRAESKLLSLITHSEDSVIIQIKDELIINRNNLLEGYRIEGKFNYYFISGEKRYWTSHPNPRKISQLRAVKVVLKITRKNSIKRLDVTCRLLKRKPIIVHPE
jgi:prepilin-type N-terminal cleavage/methylation domain-containing protein